MPFTIPGVHYVFLLFAFMTIVAEADAQSPFNNQPGAYGSDRSQIGNQNPGRIERRSLPPLSQSPAIYARPQGKFKTTGLPANLWKGLSYPEIRDWSSKVLLPVRSDALHQLLLQLYLTDFSHPLSHPLSQSQSESTAFNDLRLGTLYHAGRFQDIIDLAQNGKVYRQDPLLQTFYAWSLLALGQNGKSCELARLTPVSSSTMSTNRRASALMLNSYCSASNNELEAAMLASDLAREQGADVQIPNSILYRLSTGEKNTLKVPKKFTLLDYVFLRLTQWQPHPALFPLSETPMLIAISHDSGVSEITRLQALESAAKRKAALPQELSKLYLAQVISDRELDRLLTNPSETSGGGSIADSRQRALLFQAIDRAKEVRIKAQLISAMLENGRKAGIFETVARILSPEIQALPQTPQLVLWAEPFVEALTVSHQFKHAADWVIFASASRQNPIDGLLHWLILIDIAEIDHSISSDRALQIATEQARGGRFTKPVLHRLVSVLDALNYKISIPLWDIASRDPQPSGGFLPETGHLSHLMGAANRGETGKTIFLAVQALGPEGPAEAHIIALSDTIRALMIAGLEVEARRVGFEALFEIWPRRRPS